MTGGWNLRVRPLHHQVDLYLQVLAGGQVRAHALDHPGCFLTGSSEERVMREAPTALWKFGQWLRNHGERPPFRGGLPRVRVAERVVVPAGFPPEYGPALFAPEREAPSSEQLARFRERLAWAEEDLVSLVRGLPEEVLRRPLGPGEPTPADLLARMAKREAEYLRSLALPGGGLPEKPAHPLEQILQTRRAVLAALDRWPAPDRGQLLWADIQVEGGSLREAWTLAKLLRRLLEEQREGTALLRRRL